MQITPLKIRIFILGLVSLVCLFYFLESDTKYLQRTTKNIIQLARPLPSNSTDLDLLRRVEKIGKRLRFDINFELEKPQGGIYKITSANTVREALMVYFKQKPMRELSASNLLVQIDSKDKTRAQVSLKIAGKTQEQTLSCHVLLKWLKEKGWFIQEIKVRDCQASSSN